MAKKILWKDNTVPSTNYLWLKIGPDGVNQGLYEWNGRRWVKIASPDGGSSMTFTDLEGNEYTVTGMKETENGVELVDSEGTSVSQFVSMTYIQNNYTSNENLEEKIIEIIESYPVQELIWIEDSANLS